MQDGDFELLDNLAISYFARDRRSSNRHPGSRRGRERNGQGYLSSRPARQRRITVAAFQTQNQRSWTMTDYASVPAIEVNGSWNFGDMLNDDSIGNLLRAYAEIKGR